MAAVTIIVLAAGIPIMGSGFRKAAIIFLVAGIVLLVLSRRPISDWIASLNSMTNTVAIMVAMQVFTIPVHIGKYDEALNDFSRRRFSSPLALFAFSTTMTHMMTSFLMLGAIPVSMSLFGSSIRSRIVNHERFLAASLSRGYVLAALWAPGAINLFLVCQSTGVKWSSIFLPGLLMGAVALGISCAMESLPGGVLREAAVHEAKDSARIAASGGGSAVLHVALAAMTIVALVFAFEKLGIGLSYTRIMMSGIIVAGTWVILIRDKSRLGEAFEEYWNEGILKVRDMGPFFVAMGLFSSGLEKVGLIQASIPIIRERASALGILSIIILPLFIIGLSLIGLHPFITIVLFGTVLSKSELPLPTLSIALSLASGGAAAYMISPFAGTIMSIARYTGAPASWVGIGWNWKFSVIYFIFGAGFSVIWGSLFG